VNDLTRWRFRNAYMAWHSIKTYQNINQKQQYQKMYQEIKN